MLDLKKIFNRETNPIKLAADYRDGKNVSAFGLCAFGKAAVTALIKGDDKTLVITPDFYQARAFSEQLSPLVGKVTLLPPRHDALVYRDALSGEAVSERMKALGLIASERAEVVACPVEALLQLYPDIDRFRSHVTLIKRGEEYDLNLLVKKLIAAGYRREEQLGDIGRFSLRGDILDVWSVAEDYPVRIEFFGDEVEKLRRIDEETHISAEEKDEYLITPITEIFPTDDEIEKLSEALSKQKLSALEPDYRVKAEAIVSELISKLTAGDRSLSLGYLLPKTANSTLFEFGGFESVVFDDVKQIYDNARLHISETENRFKTLRSRGEALDFAVDCIIDEKKAFSSDCKKLAFQSVMNANRIFNPDAVYNFKTMELPAYHRDFSLLETDLKNWSARGYTIYICAGDESARKGISEFLSDIKMSGVGDYGNGGIRLITEKTDKGAIFHEEKIVVIGSLDIARKPVKKKLKRARGDIFSAPEVGDYVVHEVHGVGRFEGVVKLENSGTRRDYLLISYAGTDRLYVPVENMDVLSKYAVDGAGTPTLNKLGGADFARVKAKVRASVKELAINLVDLYGERFKATGHRYSQDDSLLHEFERSFEHTETEDQLLAIEEGIADLKNGKIMDRLLCGDVGYGKTEVALRIAFKVIEEGKQVAFLSPTTILAKQHYETVKKRMEDFGVKIGRLTRFDSPSKQDKTIAELKAGKIDIVVGTHRLLSKDVDFADLGLLILDEEQRFGVADKEKIKDVRRSVNVLTLSATPIPRTLHMSLVGIRDISVLDTPPVERLPVQTFVVEYNETLLVDACLRELNRGGQVFIVHNRVEDIVDFTARVQALLPSAKVAYAHGQMKEDALEKRIEAFVEGKFDILVASTIIENGIDIPSANTMIVTEADRLGLSQMYQLRGRVGRSNRLAYVFFTFDGNKTLTESAYQRLDAITQFTEFGSGFRIAMRDLEIRGAGSVLGAKQHGHMEKVGYDMYCKILSEEIGELKGEKTKERKEVKVSVDYAAFVPDGYVTNKEWRLRVYSKIAKIASLKERDLLLAELADIYGPVPSQAKNLIDLALIKNLASNINAERVTLKKGVSEVVFGKVMDIENSVNSAATEVNGRLITVDKPALRFPSPSHLLKFLLICCKISR